MNKKYIILFGVVMVLFIIFVVSIFLQTSSSEQATNSATKQNPSALANQQKATRSTVTFAPLASNPVAVAEQFYRYYFSSEANPLANGAYKDNPYLSPDFKDTISAIYNNGNIPLFCPQNKRTAITVGNEQQIYYDNQYLRQETISEASPGAKELYRITLENVDGKWQIFDVTCIF